MTRRLDLVTLLTVLGLTSCGSPYGARPECRPPYDACVNNCAGDCERGGARADSVGPGDTINTWDSHCGECIDRCKHLLEQCDR